jgi:hypothetical protein
MCSRILLVTAIGLALASSAAAQPPRLREPFVGSGPPPMAALPDFIDPFAGPDPPPRDGPPDLPEPYAKPGPPPIDAPGLGIDLTPLPAPQPFARAWFTADYLMWWVKGQSIPQPLITVGSSNDPVPGALGQPNTRVLFGNDQVQLGLFSGLRLGLGGWLDDDHLYGLEASGFFLPRNSHSVAFYSDGSTPAALAQPVIIPGSGEQAYSSSLQHFIAGSIWASTSTAVNGYEINLARCLTRDCNREIDLLVGFRQLTVQETLDVASDIVELQPCGLTFYGIPIQPGDHILTSDRFATSTNFYGPQIGSKISWSCGRFDFDAVGKLGIGVSQELLRVSGDTIWAPVSGPVLSAPGGILTQTTNIGSYFRDRFAVLPEVDLNMHYQIASWASLGFGYTFLYLSNVVRPGLVIDRTVDPARVPSDQAYGTGTTTNRPGVFFRDTGFWAQGLNFNVTFQY